MRSDKPPLLLRIWLSTGFYYYRRGGHNMFIQIVLLLISVLYFNNLNGQVQQVEENALPDGGIYSAADVARLHAEINLSNWLNGGYRSHFAYLNSSHFFPVSIIHRRGPVSELVYEPNPVIGNYPIASESDNNKTLDEFITEYPINGIVIIHQGRIVYERYPRMQMHDHHLLHSVTKALIGTTVGILEDRGEIDIDLGIDVYISELKNTGWEGIIIRDILEMASGIEGSEMIGEPFDDPVHKHYQLEASLGQLPADPEHPAPVHEGETYELLRSLTKIDDLGMKWHYASVNTAVLGWLLERVTGKPLARVLSDEIWSHIGAESDALMVINKKGIPVSHAGMVTTLRDLARFGLLFTQSWNVVSDKQIISGDFLKRILENGRTELFGSDSERMRPDWYLHPAYQWDVVTEDGAFYKGGFGNQLLYVDPVRDVVIAYFGFNESKYQKIRLPLRKMVMDLF